MLGAISLISPQANRREPERTAGTAPSTLRHLLEDLDRTGEVALGTLRERYPIVTAVHRPADIARDFFCVIQVDTRSAKPGMIRNLLAGAAYCLPRPKYVVVVDTDIDIYRLEDVLWAMCVRVHPQHDVTLIPDTFGSPIDPRGPTPPLTAKLLIDATTKADSVGTMSGPPDKARQRAAEILERAARA